MPVSDTIIIGSGIAGLSCGIGLAAGNINAMILDKGRNIGGRMATRVTPASFEFDHGARYIKANDTNFQRVIQEGRSDLVLAQWEDGSVDHHFCWHP